MNEMLEHADVFTYSTFRIMPMKYGTRYMLNYVDNEILYNYLEDMLDFYKVRREVDEHYAADYDIVDYNGEEYYFVNLLDYNLVNLYKA